MILSIHTEFISLDALLKWANVVSSGGEAKILISEGLVCVNGETVYQRKKKIKPGDSVVIEGMDDPIEVTKE